MRTFLLAALLLLAGAAGSSLHAQPGKRTATPSASPRKDTLVDSTSYFGPLQIDYVVSEGGGRLDCSLTLGGALGGMYTLYAVSPNYRLDIIVNNLKVDGWLRLRILPPNQISTLEGDFYVVKETADTIRFKGTIAGWYCVPQQRLPSAARAYERAGLLYVRRKSTVHGLQTGTLEAGRFLGRTCFEIFNVQCSMLNFQVRPHFGSP
ncbi:MAG TPA: hypothetical protein VGB46_05465 [Flavisolibacter sp.]